RKTQHWEEQLFVKAVKRFRITEAHRADRVAVIGLRQRSDSRALFFPFELPILHCHLHGYLDGGGAAVGVKHSPQTLRRDADQFFGELNPRHRAQAEKRRMGNPLELSAERVVELFFAMAVNVAPKRR